MATSRNNWTHSARRHKCDFCDEMFPNRKEVKVHQQSHDFFSCIHCMELLKLKQLTQYKLPKPYDSNTNDALTCTPRLITNIIPSKATSVLSGYLPRISPDDNKCNNDNDVSSNGSKRNPRKRKHEHTDLQLIKNDSDTLQQPNNKKQRVSARDILDLVSDDNDSSSSPIMRNHSPPHLSPSNADLTQSKNDTNVDDDDGDDDSDSDEDSDTVSADLDDIDLIKINKSKAVTVTVSAELDVFDLIKINQSKAENDQDSESEDIEVLTPPKCSKKPVITSNDEVMDWQSLDFKNRNEDSFRYTCYVNADKKVLSALLNKKLEQQILKDIADSRPNKTELKLKQYLMEFIIHKTRDLMRKNRYYTDKDRDSDYSQFVHLYGSIATQTDSAQCDVDIAVDIQNTMESKQFLRQLANLLQRHTIKRGKKFKIERIFKATVPIVKIRDPLYDIEADISIYKSQDATCKYINSLLNYNNDQRIRQLIIAIKHWTKKRNINCTMTGKINSFGFTILVLKYLQMIKNPILPIMDYKRYDMSERERAQIISSEPYKDKCESNPMYKYYTSSLGYHSMHIYTRNYVEIRHVNNMGLDELLYGFFEFYGHFNYEELEVSLHSQYLQRKQVCNYAVSTDQLMFVIEDPVERHNNCAKNVRFHTAQLLINEFRRAHIILLYGGDWINDVCCRTLLQPHCLDQFTLNKQIKFYKHKKLNTSDKCTNELQYIKQYVVDKYMAENGYCVDSYYANSYSGNGNKRMRGKQKAKNKKNRHRYHRRNTF